MLPQNLKPKKHTLSMQKSNLSHKGCFPQALLKLLIAHTFLCKRAIFHTKDAFLKHIQSHSTRISMKKSIFSRKGCFPHILLELLIAHTLLCKRANFHIQWGLGIMEHLDQRFPINVFLLILQMVFDLSKKKKPQPTYCLTNMTWEHSSQSVIHATSNRYLLLYLASPFWAGVYAHDDRDSIPFSNMYD